MGHLWGVLANCGLKSSGEGNKFIRDLQDGARSQVFDGDCAGFWGGVTLQVGAQAGPTTAVWGLGTVQGDPSRVTLP